VLERASRPRFLEAGSELRLLCGPPAFLAHQTTACAHDDGWRTVLDRLQIHVESNLNSAVTQRQYRLRFRPRAWILYRTVVCQGALYY
jgi:hypothetical protein